MDVDPKVYWILLYVFLFLGLLGISMLIFQMMALMRLVTRIANLASLYEEDRRYLGGIYQQIVESNEMLASAENNSYIIASKAIEPPQA